MLSTMTLAAGPLVLMGFWQPLLVLIPLAGWAWLVSTVFDKHAARFFLGQEMWGLAHLAAAGVGLAAIIFMPLEGIAGFALGYLVFLLVLGLDIGLFVAITNNDDRVPETAKLSLDFSAYAEKQASKKAAKQAGSSTLQISGPKGSVRVPDRETPEYAVRLAAEQLVIEGRQRRASQIDVLPANAQAYAPQFLVDGVRQTGEPIPAADAVRIIDFWKGTAGLSVEDRRRKQTGAATFRTDAGSTDMRIQASGSQQGMRLTVVYDPQEAVRRAPEDLGLSEQQLESARELANTGGVVLLAAPSDNGRTTTLYSFLRLHDAYTSNVQTLELESEDELEGIRQVIFDPAGEGPTFSTQLRSLLRRDPDVVGVAELPDEETAQEAARVDASRTRVYLSMRNESALGALQLWTKAVGDAKAAAEPLRGVLCQRLVRALCQNCRVAYPPTPEVLKKLGLPADRVKQLYKKGGQVMLRNKPELCPVCGGAGYFGQRGVFEFYPLDETHRGLIAQGNWKGLQAELRKTKLPTLQQAALRQAVAGETSLEEVMRISTPSKSSGKSSGQSGSKPGSKPGGQPKPASKPTSK